MTSRSAGIPPGFKSSLTSLRRGRRFISWSESTDFAASVFDVLRQLDEESPDPRRGVECLLAFFRVDAATLGRCDDSNGSVGDAFRIDARDAFARYASRCDDKAWLVEQVLALLDSDDHGVRASILECAADYLPVASMRALADRFWAAAEALPTKTSQIEQDWPRKRWLLLVEPLARQLRDPVLFERARRAAHPGLGPAACNDIAEAWLEAGDAKIALEWLGRVPENVLFQSDRHDDLLRTVHLQLGNRVELERLSYRRFEQYRSAETLKALLAVIGADARADVIASASDRILAAERFVAHDAVFLLEHDHPEVASVYVISRRAQLDGDGWSALVPLAREFETAGGALAATVLYRALLESILRRAEVRTYGHGARYLHRLGRLAPHVRDWQEVEPHAEYDARIRTKHARKSSFWKRYEGVRA